jgi:hypothetical protein
LGTDPGSNNCFDGNGGRRATPASVLILGVVGDRTRLRRILTPDFLDF